MNFDDELDRETGAWAATELRSHLDALRQTLSDVDDEVKTETPLDHFVQQRDKFDALAGAADRFARAYKATAGVFDGPPEIE